MHDGDDDGPAERARASWAALARFSLRSGSGGARVVEPGRGWLPRPVHAWPLSQVLHAAALMRLSGLADPPRDLIASLDGYRKGAGCTDSPGRGRRYYDDNAWLGLAAAQAGDLARAGWLFEFVRSGEDPAGGVRWVEGAPARHACSTGAAGLLALAVPDAGRRAFAARCRDFLRGPLRRPDGLVGDHLDADGRLEPTAWAYNQGLLVGLHVHAHLHGDAAGLAAARALAGDTLDHLGAEGLWRQPAAFTAVLLRQLLRLAAVDGDHRWRDTVSGYLDRAWEEARDPRTGWFSRGGIGRYDDGDALDQAALAQLFALQAAGPQLWARVL